MPIGAKHTVFFALHSWDKSSYSGLRKQITLCEGLDVTEACSLIRSSLPMSNLYINCWELSRDCLVNGREESLLSRARALYEDRAHGEFGDGQAAYDWNRAQAQKDNRNEFMH